MKVERWSRGDQLFLEGLLWALPGVALLHVVVQLVRTVRGDALSTTGSLPDELVTAAGGVTGPLQGTVVVDDPSTAQAAWALLPAVLLLVLAVVASRLLLAVVRSLRLGDPFTTANARRLTVLGVVVVVGGVLLPMLSGVAHQAVVEPVLPGDGRSWSFEVELWPALSGVLIGFLAEVFARGARLREDVEGLV